MHNADYYRSRAETARRLAGYVTGGDEMTKTLQTAAKDYDELAEDLEIGAVEIRHPDLMPQRR